MSSFSFVATATTADSFTPAVIGDIATLHLVDFSNASDPPAFTSPVLNNPVEARVPASWHTALNQFHLLQPGICSLRHRSILGHAL